MVVEGKLIGGSLTEATFEIEVIQGGKQYITGSADPELLKGFGFGSNVTATLAENDGKYTLVNLANK